MLPTSIQRQDWNRRKGTYTPGSRMGKMNVVKMWIPPKLLYRFNTAPVNRQNGLDQLDKVILEFIRKNKALSTDIFF